ncbi:MAG: Cerebroside-sulfatase [Planctomycetaceae bacterium]|nr:Cerebroside-sulfatase [Planctomycetaceae bacterium]
MDLLIGLLLSTGVAVADPTPSTLHRAATAAKQSPNILLILADDVGQEVLGCYGGKSYPTPHIDSLARDGMKFHHAYSMPVCHPTRIALMTGRYPFRFGQPAWGSFPKRIESQTFSRLLQGAGYATAVAGKWQLALLKRDPQHPRRLGFDAYSLFGWHEGPRYHDPLLWQNGRQRQDLQGKYGPDVYVDFLVDFMKRNRGGPFLAYFSMALCHDVTDDLPQPVPFGPGKTRYDSYAEMARQMDRIVGRLLTALDQQRLRDNTVVIFTTDNGTPKRSIAGVRNGQFYREPVVSLRGSQRIAGGKGNLRDDGTRVPLLVRWPRVTAAGSEVDGLVDSSDFLPTLLDLAGAQPPADLALDGRSFSPLLRARPGPQRRWCYAGLGGRHWVRTKRFKLYRDGRFFDVASDVNERRPLDQATVTGNAKAALNLLAEALVGLQSKR